MAGLELVRRWPGLKSKPWVENLVARASEEKSIAAIIIIGSAIRPRGHRRSDLDLLVLYRGTKPKLRAPVGVDVRHYPVESADKLIAEGNELLGWAVRFGYALYDPAHEWGKLHNKWTNILPLPSADEARQRADRSLDVARDLLEAGDEAAASDLALAAITQIARARLIKKGVYPASRPELPLQLRDITESTLADLLEDALYKDFSTADLLDRLNKVK
ncbi:nucleotidyltransferase domain-containing protein [Archangium sp.]|uniref:nucleotidyltransferase domain-containing protein n=1 Tax=Archangium sp. TaxID=1872627 RepID=UPI002D6C2C31|nr:nucleotidyltransferase domain-containing protein [Archangium sp.]HYO58244.1 nucleotidyltransferase domain-containing protein [Archangium sp.]